MLGFRPPGKILLACCAVFMAGFAKLSVHEFLWSPDSELLSVKNYRNTFLRGGFAVPVKTIRGSIFAGLDNGDSKLPGVNVEAWAATHNSDGVTYSGSRHTARSQHPVSLNAGASMTKRASIDDEFRRNVIQEAQAEDRLLKEKAENAKLQAEIKAAKEKYAAQSSSWERQPHGNLEAAEEMNAKLKAEIAAAEKSRASAKHPSNPFGVLARSPSEPGNVRGVLDSNILKTEAQHGNAGEINALGVLARSPAEPGNVYGVLSMAKSEQRAVEGVLSHAYAKPNNVGGVLMSKQLDSSAASAGGVLDRVKSKGGDDFLEAEGSLALIKGTKAGTEGSLYATAGDDMWDGVLNHVGKGSTFGRSSLKTLDATAEPNHQVDGSLSAVTGNDMADGVLNRVSANTIADGVLSRVRVDSMEDGILNHVSAAPSNSEGSLAALNQRGPTAVSRLRMDKEDVDGSLSKVGDMEIRASVKAAKAVAAGSKGVVGDKSTNTVEKGRVAENAIGDLAEVSGSNAGGVLETMEQQRRDWVAEQERLHAIQLERGHTKVGTKVEKRPAGHAEAIQQGKALDAEQARLKRLRERVAGLRQRALAARVIRAGELQQWDRELQELHGMEARRLAAIRAAQVRAWKAERIVDEAMAYRHEMAVAAAAQAALTAEERKGDSVETDAVANEKAAVMHQDSKVMKVERHHPALHQRGASRVKAASRIPAWPRRSVQTAEAGGAFRELEDAPADPAGAAAAAARAPVAEKGTETAKEEDYGDIGWVKHRWTAVGWTLFAVFGPAATAGVTGLVAWIAGPIAAVCTFVIMAAMDVASYYYSWYTL